MQRGLLLSWLSRPALMHLQVDKVNALEPSMQQLSDDALRGKTAEFKSRVQRGERLDDLLFEAFAVSHKSFLWRDTY